MHHLLTPAATTTVAKRLLPLLLLPLLPSCLGDQIGGANPGGTEDDCIDIGRRTYAADDMTELGFRARDILDFVATTRELPFSMSIDEESYSGLVIEPETLDTTLQLSINPSAEKVTLVERAHDPNSKLSYDCRDYLDIEGSVVLRTDNGAFDDTLPVLVRARNVASAEAWVTLAPGSMQGTFDLIQDDKLVDISLTDPPAVWVHHETVLKLDYTVPDSVRGSLTAFYRGERPDEEPHTASLLLWRTPDGSWPCYAEDFGGNLDDGQAVSRLSSFLADTPRLSFQFTKGGGVDVQLDAELELSPSFCVLGDIAPALTFSGHLVLSRAGTSESLGIWEMDGSATYSADGRFEGVRLSAVTDSANASDFGVDLSEAGDVKRHLWLQRDRSGDWRGDLHLETSGSGTLAEATISEVARE